MSSTRWVLVDDKDSGINYSGAWFETSNAFSGNWGAPLAGSQHGTNGSASFSYTFTGASFAFYGVFPVLTTEHRVDRDANTSTRHERGEPNYRCSGSEVDLYSRV